MPQPIILRLVLGSAVFCITAADAVAQERFFTTQFSRREVDLDQLARTLARIRLPLPLEISGRVSVEGSIGYPRGALLAPRRYRIEATLASERLVIEGLELHNVRAELLYQDGVARLRELSFRVPHGDQPPGLLSGSAALPLDPPGDLTANLTIADLPIERVLALFPGLEDFAAGRASGEVRARVDPGQLRDVTAWRLAGNVNLENAVTQGLPPLNATAQFQAAEGLLSVTQLQGTMRTARLGAAGRLTLTAPYRFQADVRLNDDQLAWLNELPEDFRPPAPLAGVVRLSGRARGQLEPFLWRLEAAATAQPLQAGELLVESLRGDVTARSRVDRFYAPELFPGQQPDETPWRIGGTIQTGGVRIAGVLVEALQSTIAVDPERLELSNLAATLYGGAARGSSVFPLTETGEARLALSLERVEVGRLLDDLGVFDFPVRGEAAGLVNVTLPVDAPDDVARWRGGGQLSLADVDLFQWTSATALANFQLERGEIVLSDFALAEGASRLSLSGRIGLRSPHPYQLTVEGRQFNLARFNGLPEAIRPPVELSGVGNFEVEGTGTLDPFDFLGRGGLGAAPLQVNEVIADSVQLRFASGEEQWEVTDLAAALYGGLVRGDMTIPRGDEGDARLAWRLQGVALGRLLEDLDVLDFPFRGEAEGAVDLDIPVHAADDLTQWRGVGRLTLSDVQALAWTAEAARADFQLERGALLLSELMAVHGPMSLLASGSIAFDAPYEYALHAAWTNFDLSKLNALPPNVRPPVELAGFASLQVEGHGFLEPFSFTGSGAGGAAAIRVNDVEAGTAQFEFRADDRQIEVLRLEAALYDGRIHGSGVWPREETAPAQAEVHWRSIDLGRLLGDAIELPVSLEGPSNGDVTLLAPPGTLDDFRQWEFRADVSSEEIRINGVRAASFRATAERVREMLDYRLDASVLDGQLQVAGRLPLSETAEEHTGQGTFTLTNFQFNRVADIFRQRESLRGLRGVLDVHASLEHEHESFAPRGAGFFQLREIELSGVSLIDRLDGRLLFTPEYARMEQVAGGLAGGRIQAAVTYPLGARRPGNFEISLRGAEVDRLAGIWLEEFPLAGSLDLVLRGRLGDVWQATGGGLVTRAETAGFSLGTVRSPIVVEFAPEQGRGQLTLRGASASLARGRTTGNLELSWGYGLNLNTRLRFDNADVPDLLKQAGAGGDWAAGRLSGSLTLSGRNIRSAGDLNGSFEARLRNVQALKLPVLEALRPYTGGASFNARFEEGDVKATLGRGVVRVQRLTLMSEAAQVYVEGTATVSGRLNLSAVIHTGSFRAVGLAAERLVQALAVSVAPPATLLTEATEFLSNRVIHLHIGGTVSRPIPRVQPLPILREEAIRFFFNQVRPGA